MCSDPSGNIERRLGSPIACRNVCTVSDLYPSDLHAHARRCGRRSVQASAADVATSFQASACIDSGTTSCFIEQATRGRTHRPLSQASQSRQPPQPTYDSSHSTQESSTDIAIQRSNRYSRQRPNSLPAHVVSPTNGSDDCRHSPERSGLQRLATPPCQSRISGLLGDP